MHADRACPVIEGPVAATPEMSLRAALHDLQVEAVGLGDVDLARQVAALDERLRSRRVLIAVVGEHNRGKSSLIDSVIGSAWLPVGQAAPALPPVYIAGGAAERVELVYHDGSVAESTRAELLTLSLDDAASVAYARVLLPSPDLFGLVLVDTPGLNDPDTSRLAQTVYGLLPASDLALLVLDSAQALGASELALVERQILQARLQRLVVILNRNDALEDDTQRSAVRDRVLDRLTPLLGTEPTILPFAARHALRARERHDARLLARSGYPELRALLEECAADRTRILEQTAVEKAIEATLTLRRRLLEPAAPIVEVRMDGETSLTAKVAAASRALDSIRESYVLELRAFSIELRDRLPEELAESSVEDIRRYLPFYIQEQYGAFLQGHEATIMEQAAAALAAADLDQLPVATPLAGRALAPGLHPMVTADLLDESVLLMTFMQVVGLALYPLVTGALMTIGPALRMLTRRVREQEERDALLHTAQGAILDAGMVLETQVNAAFATTDAAVRRAVQPTQLDALPVSTVPAAREASRERLDALLSRLEEHLPATTARSVGSR